MSAELYRREAEECRRLAEEAPGEVEKAEWRRLAAGWQRLAHSTANRQTLRSRASVPQPHLETTTENASTNAAR